MNNKKDYSNTVIYKIVCNDENIKDVYVGTTTNFKNRKSCHKSNCNNEKRAEYNYNIYKFIRNNNGWDNFSMTLIENFPCNNSLEAHERERYHYDILNCTLNMQIPNRTLKEYYKENKEKINETHKLYNQNNKDKIKERKRLYRLKNKEKIRDYNKEYYEQQKLNN
jgi:hypothetical protein